MKRLLVVLFGLFFGNVSYGANAVNVQYLHNLISRMHQVDLKYNTSLPSPGMIVNMKYLLMSVDLANKKLNGVKTTDYISSQYATEAAADTVAVNYVVKNLIKKVVEDEEQGGEFWMTPAGSSTTFSFTISAAGNYVIDWGDGSTAEVINKTDTNTATYSHTYSSAASNYKIALSGQATKYSTNDETAAVAFTGTSSASKLSAIEGCLGCIFGTLADGAQPRFFQTFRYNSALKTLPDELFSGIYGDSVTRMFRRTFQYCSGLTELPAGLFAGLRGQPAQSMFSSTFDRCTSLKRLPEGLLDSFYGYPVYEMFNNTFCNCTSLEEIPAGLFKNINGTPASKMFNYTFENCTKLTSIPADLFGNLEGELAASTFSYMFKGCSGLTGESAKINGQYLYEIWPDATSSQVNDMYNGCSKLTDYSAMPTVWK
jgi:hypothetical protein